MIPSIVSVLFAGYLASCNKGSVSAESTAVLLGGWWGETESYPCDVAIGNVGYSGDGLIGGLGAAVLNGQIVYCGGRPNFDETQSNCFKNVGTDWIEIESMNVARHDFTLTSLGDKIFAAGGYNSQYTASVEVFDGSSWKLQNYELTSARESHCAVPISQSQDQVLLIGGYDGSWSSLVEIYSIEEGFLAELPSMPTARYGLGCSMFKGEIWTAGGSGDDLYVDLDVVEVLRLDTNTWRSGPKLTRRRSYLTMEVLDNSLVVFGGYGAEDILEKFNGEEWRRESLQVPHFYHASVVIPC